MINKPSPFKGLNIRIPIIIPIKGRRFINQGSTLPYLEDHGDLVSRLRTPIPHIVNLVMPINNLLTKSP